MSKLDVNYFFVCGPAGSGKSTVAKILAEQWEADFVEISDIVKAITQKNARSDIGCIPELDAQIIEELKKIDKPTVISGVRQPSILEPFLNGECAVLYTAASQSVRERRANDRGDNKDNVSIEKADAFDKQLGLFDIPELFKNI